MNGKLFNNKSPRNKVNKTLSNETTITLRYKETTSVTDPDIIISSDITITDYNYIFVGSPIERYYYIESYEMAQQYIILHCHVDVLKSFSGDIYNTECIISKNQKAYNLFLNDDKMQLYNKSRILTKPFYDGNGNASGFYVGGEKVWTMLLTLNGSGRILPVNNGGDE